MEQCTPNRMNTDSFLTRADTFELLPWFTDPALNSWIAEHLSWHGSSVADIGSGTGIMAPYYEQFFEEVHLVEPSRAMAERLSSRDLLSTTQVHQATLQEFQAEENHVDVVVSKNSFHHLPDNNQSTARMAEIARHAVAIVEIIAPTSSCMTFLEEVVLRKEPERTSATIYTAESLVGFLNPHTESQRLLICDQYIDVGTWLEHSPLEDTERNAIDRFIRNQRGTVKSDMHIHVKRGRLRMLRRVGMAIGLHNNA